MGKTSEGIIQGGGEGSRKRKIFKCRIGKVGLCVVGLRVDGSCQGRSELSKIGERADGIDSRVWW